MKNILTLLLALLTFSAYGQKGTYEIECRKCELQYGETECSSCPGNMGVGVTLFEGVVVIEKNTGKELAYIPAPFKPKLMGERVEIYTQTSETKVNGLPTGFRAKFGEFVLPDYSNYANFPALVDSLRSCGACILTAEAEPNLDNDPSNELNTGMAIVADELQITDAGGTLTAPLAAYLDNTDSQTLSLAGSDLSISGGNTVTLPPDGDAVTGNEYNTSVTLNGTDLETTDGGGTIVTDLSSLVDDADADPANEHNTGIGLAGTVLSITDGGGTLSQDISGAIPPNLDNDPTNEYNTAVSLIGTSLEVTDGGGTIATDLSPLINDADSDPANEIQDISYTQNSLSITGGSTLDITPDAVTDGDGDTGISITEGANDAINFDVDGSTVMELTDSKLTLNSIFIDPATGLELEQQGSVPALADNPANTLWINSADGHLYRGSTDIEAQATDLGIGAQGTNVLEVTSSSGTNVNLPVATPLLAGVMSGADKAKLDGIAAGAEANVQSDWNETDNTSDSYILNKPAVTPPPVLAMGNGTNLNGTTGELGGSLDKNTDIGLGAFSYSLTSPYATYFHGNNGFFDNAVITKSTGPNSSTNIGIMDFTAFDGDEDRIFLGGFDFMGNPTTRIFIDPTTGTINSNSTGRTSMASSLDFFVQSDTLVSIGADPDAGILPGTHQGGLSINPLDPNTPSIVMQLNNNQNYAVGYAAIDSPAEKFSNLFYGELDAGNTITDYARVQASDLGAQMYYRHNPSDAQELAIGALGLNYSNTAAGDLLNVDLDGEITAPAYPETRDDTGANPIRNVLYTGSSGELLSAPLHEARPRSAAISNASAVNLANAAFTDVTLATTEYNDLGGDITVTPSGFTVNTAGTYEFSMSALVTSAGQRATTLYSASDGTRNYPLGGTYVRGQGGIDEDSESGTVTISVAAGTTVTLQTRREGATTDAVTPSGIGGLIFSITRIN